MRLCARKAMSALHTRAAAAAVGIGYRISRTARGTPAILCSVRHGFGRVK